MKHCNQTYPRHEFLDLFDSFVERCFRFAELKHLLLVLIVRIHIFRFDPSAVEESWEQSDNKLETLSNGAPNY